MACSSRAIYQRAAQCAAPGRDGGRCRKLSELGLKVEVRALKRSSRLGYGAFLGVAQGSANEARMVVMQSNGAAGNVRRLRASL